MTKAWAGKYDKNITVMYHTRTKAHNSPEEYKTKMNSVLKTKNKEYLKINLVTFFFLTFWLF